MTLDLIFWWAMAIAIVIVLHMFVRMKAANLRLHRQLRARDASLFVDAWTAERRAQLAQLSHPAKKGWDGRTADRISHVNNFKARAK